MTNPRSMSPRNETFCTRCFEVVTESRIHVIPFYNASVRGFVTTHRCDRCWLASLDETRARLESTTDEWEVASVALFFERHGHFLHEFRRGDPTSVVKGLLSHILDMLRSGAIRLHIVAETRTLAEFEQLRAKFRGHSTDT
jgi:hypothetical protein